MGKLIFAGGADSSRTVDEKWTETEKQEEVPWLLLTVYPGEDTGVAV